MKYALKLIFLKCIFKFMINTAPTASNRVYSREKLFWYGKIKFQTMAGRCGAVVKELLARADKPGSTPGYDVFCFFATFFFFFFFPVWSLLLTLFFLWPFFLYSYCWPWWSCTWMNDILSLIKSRGFLETAEFFSMLVDIMTNNTQYTTNCSNLHPTPTSDPLAKV